MTANTLIARPALCLCPADPAPQCARRLSQLSSATLRFGEPLDLAAVLALVAEQAAGLLDGVCHVRYAPAQQPGEARSVIAGPGVTPVVQVGLCSGTRHSSLFGSLVQRHLRRDGPSAAALAAPGQTGEPAPGGATLLIAPLVARGRRLGRIDVVVAAQDDERARCDQRMLHALASHAALAIDNAVRFASVQAQADAAAGDADARAEVRNATLLLAMAAHDLRGPLTALSSSVQLLVRKTRNVDALDRATLARLAELAESAVTQLEAQVVALGPGLSPASAGAGASPQPVDLVRLTGLMANLYQQTTGRHQLAVLAGAPELCGPWLQPHLERVLGNLLANAIKYSPDGGTIRVTVARQEDSLGDWAALSVQNEGIGVPPSDLPQLGQPGYRASNVGSIPGTGFGLASVRELVEQYGGTLAIRSLSGGITTVLVRLPLAHE